MSAERCGNSTRVIRSPSPGDSLQLSLDKDKAQGYAQQTGPGPLTGRRRDRRPYVYRGRGYTVSHAEDSPRNGHTCFFYFWPFSHGTHWNVIILKNALNYVRLGRLNFCVVYMETNSGIRIETRSIGRRTSIERARKKRHQTSQRF